MVKPKLSIIVAVYNTSKYLEKCLSKVVNQKMPMKDFEVIIVNDCSTDNSMEIIQKYAQEYENIKVIDKKVNEATFWSRVDGMKMAIGDYVGFVDSDDWPEENMFPMLYRVAVEKSADIVECQFIVDGDGELEKDSPFEEGNQVVEQVVETFVKRKMSAALWMRIYSREIKQSVLNQIAQIENREKFCGIRNEDEFLFPMLLNRATSYYVLKQRLYHYRVDSGGSIMKEISEDYQKKLFHADTVIAAGNVLLEDSKSQKKYHELYAQMQTNNIFYLVGILLKGQCWDSMPKYQEVFRQYWKIGQRLNFRNIHLYIKCLYIKFVWKSQRNRR